MNNNTKLEIKESVKREVEIAGVDYLLVKYTKNNKSNISSSEYSNKNDLNIEVNECLNSLSNSLFFIFIDVMLHS